MNLTQEQKQKIERNKQMAIAKRLEKSSPQKPSFPTSSSANSKIDDCNHRLCPGHCLNTTLTGSALCKKQDQMKSLSRMPASINGAQTKLVNSSTSISAMNTQPKKAVSTVGSGPQNGFPMKSSVADHVTLLGKCVYTGNNSFTVEVGYSAPLVQFFKQMTTRNYDASTKLWSFQMEEYNQFIGGVQGFLPTIKIEGLPPWILKIFGSQQKQVDVVAPEVDLSHVDQKLVQALLPFQTEGVKCAIQHDGRLLIADDMGLGKTLQALCIASYYRKEWPLLIVSPSSVRFDWAQQMCKWLPSVAPCDVNVVETGKAAATTGKVNIVSYDLLSKKLDELKQKKFQVVIMDESHFLKNSRTVRTKAAMPLLKIAKRVLLLSGTPALSRPIELFSQIIAVCPNLFKFHDFGLRYCNAKQMPWGWDYSSCSNMVELQALLEKKVMIRRQKNDVLSQLPAKHRQVVMLDPTSVHKNKDLKVASQTISSGKLKGMNQRGALLEYFHETSKAKMTAVRDYILDLIEGDKKFLVFAHHKEMLDCIEDCIQSKASHIEYMRIDGRTTSEQRSFFCQKFQTNENCKVAILSITAANAGLNLSAANIVVFAELFWNPGILVQAEDRAHRIGQQDSVTVQYLVAQHTADDYIWPIVQTKLNTLSRAGLAKDDFGDTDTKHLKNTNEQTLLDMFRKEFIEDEPRQDPASLTQVPEVVVNIDGRPDNSVDVNVISSSALNITITVPVEELAKSPKKRVLKKSAANDWTKNIPSNYSIMKSQTQNTQEKDKTPTKRQISITSFFERTPPKKICLENMRTLDDPGYSSPLLNVRPEVKNSTCDYISPSINVQPADDRIQTCRHVLFEESDHDMKETSCHTGAAGESSSQKLAKDVQTSALMSTDISSQTVLFDDEDTFPSEDTDLVPIWTRVQKPAAETVTELQDGTKQAGGQDIASEGSQLTVSPCDLWLQDVNWDEDI